MSQLSYKLGQSGEKIGRKIISDLGYKIIATNYRTQRGEIDIIAWDKDELVFVEVKRYSFRNYNTPLGAISKKKRRGLVYTAKKFLFDSDISDVYCRFDVLSIYYKENKEVVVEHTKNAFGEEGC
jgi:putative endonuclease